MICLGQLSGFAKFPGTHACPFSKRFRIITGTAKAGGKSDFCYSHIGFPEKLSTFIQAVLIQIEIWTLAEIYGKDPSWIRAGLITGYLPIGNATRNGQVITSIDQMNSKFGRINYYISPKKLYDETGYIWKGRK